LFIYDNIHMQNNKLYCSHALSFDDVLIVPQHSNVQSRELPDVSTKLTRNITIKHPVISTNMSTVTEYEMMFEMWKSGSFGVLHRFMDTNEYNNQLNRYLDICTNSQIPLSINAAISVGVKGEEINNKWLEQSCVSVVVVDIAHGDSQSVIDTIKHIKKEYPHKDVIAGNVATKSGFKRLVDAGADGIRAGIGGGSACTTRLVTGSGIPTLASIIDCAEASKETGVPLIADGGIKNSGDAVKALAFGASVVCVGNVLAGTSSTPGAVLELPDGRFKEYYGMSSATAQNRLKNGKRRGVAAEGIDKLIPYKGDTNDVLLDFIGGIKSGLAYSGAMNIEQLRCFYEYITLSVGSMRESKFG
jgi:IMP dehydrogenase